ncbi:MAG: hypothetical protein QGG26_06110 [Candidatus Undinarchaeales archaeon]|nr:hypothetical protein [Candidatus Undinarchaeales archaeon]
MYADPADMDLEGALLETVGEKGLSIYQKASERTLHGYHVGPLPDGQERDTLETLGVLDRKLPGVYKVMGDKDEIVHRSTYLSADRKLVERNFEEAMGRVRSYLADHAPQYLQHLDDLTVDILRVVPTTDRYNGCFDSAPLRMTVEDKVGDYGTLPTNEDVLEGTAYEGYTRSAQLQTIMVHEAMHHLHNGIREAPWPFTIGDPMFTLQPDTRLKEGFALVMEEQVLAEQGTKEMQDLYKERMSTLHVHAKREYTAGYWDFSRTLEKDGLKGVFEQAINGDA